LIKTIMEVFGEKDAITQMSDSKRINLESLEKELDWEVRQVSEINSCFCFHLKDKTWPQ
jgi:hypothetical protein